jgi:drug/metabolite transporter (DMT)-like permease
MDDSHRQRQRAHLFALGAIGLWGTLAWLGVLLAPVPPFLLVGCALCGAGLIALPTWRRWRVAPRVLATGIAGLFGFHFFLFVALKNAPPIEANLINYLWPLLIVLLAPLFLPATRLGWTHVMGACLGFCGAALIIASGRGPASSAPSPHPLIGYTCAIVSALIWASYSLACRRLRERGSVFSSAAVGLFCLCSGLLALACHALFEPGYHLELHEIVPLAALAIGPMGSAFFLWDAALAKGDARTIGTLAYLTPLLSTLVLAASGHGHAGWLTLASLVLIVGGAWLGSRHTPRPPAAPV